MKRLAIILLSNMLLVSQLVYAQPTPASPQAGSILIMNAKAHLGNGQVIANSAIAFEGGKLTMVADATVIRIDVSKYKEVIDASGKDVYPGFIAPNTTLGLVEIEAIRATRDFNEVGHLNPHIRSLIAYNSDSKVIPTVRCNGTLIAQVTPQGGRISGQSSVVQLDAWNWEDAAVRTDDGIHINWPYPYKGGYGEPMAANDDYTKEVQKLYDYFDEVKAYCQKTTIENKNLRFEAMRGMMDGSKNMYIHVGLAKPLREAILFAEKYGLRPVIIGGEEAWMQAAFLKEHQVPVIFENTQALPVREDSDIAQPFKNAAILQQAGVLVAFSMEGSWQLHNLQFQAGQAVAYGLDYEAAISALTLNIARILGIDKTLGSLEVGKDATLFISEGDVLDMRTSKLTRAFIQGRNINLDNKQKELYRMYKDKYGK